MSDTKVDNILHLDADGNILIYHCNADDEPLLLIRLDVVHAKIHPVFVDGCAACQLIKGTR